MARYEFTITIAAEGSSPEEAWNEAVESLALDPGCVPDDFVVTETDEDGNEITETNDGVYAG